MINNLWALTGHRTVKSKDINIETGSSNCSVILQVVKSLPEKYESKVIERCMSDGDMQGSTRLKLLHKWDLILCHLIYLSWAEREKKILSGAELCLLVQWSRDLVHFNGWNGLKLYLKLIKHCTLSTSGLCVLCVCVLSGSTYVPHVGGKKQKERWGDRAWRCKAEKGRQGTPSNLWWTRWCTLKQGILPQTVPVKTPSVEIGPGICHH